MPNRMLVAIIGIGLPGSGKTTYLKPLSADLSATYIAVEEMRSAVARAPKRYRTQMLWDELYRHSAYCLDAGRSVVIDATNVVKGRRQTLVDHCHQHGASVRGILLDTPPAISYQNHLVGRRRPMDEPTFDRMCAQLRHHPPTADEFDEFVVVSWQG